MMIFWSTSSVAIAVKQPTIEHPANPRFFFPRWRLLLSVKTKIAINQKEKRLLWLYLRNGEMQSGTSAPKWPYFQNTTSTPHVQLCIFHWLLALKCHLTSMQSRSGWFVPEPVVRFTLWQSVGNSNAGSSIGAIWGTSCHQNMAHLQNAAAYN